MTYADDIANQRAEHVFGVDLEKRPKQWRTVQHRPRCRARCSCGWATEWLDTDRAIWVGDPAKAAHDAHLRDVDLATDLGFTPCPQCGQRSAADALCEACARDLTDLQRDRAEEWDAPFRDEELA